MASLGNLSINIVANTAALEAGLAKARNLVAEFRRENADVLAVISKAEKPKRKKKRRTSRRG